ncbi:MAG: cell division protein FtsZ, partial [Candidatus Thermoplasmatota archaeon]
MGCKMESTGFTKQDLDAMVRNLKIKVIGAGGGGCNSINRLMRIGVQGAETTAINTDAVHLRQIRADRQILIGRRATKGQGAGGKPEVGEQCAEEAREELTEALMGADIIFITAGMGGGTGTGASPVIAEIGKECGAIVVAIVTTPFDAERARLDTARAGLERLRGYADSTIVLDNNRLLRLVPKLPFDEALSVMDQLISETIKSVTEAITRPSMINIDLADLKTILRCGGTSTILYGENSAREPERVVIEALNNPFLEIDYTGAKGALIHVTVGHRTSISTVH